MIKRLNNEMPGVLRPIRVSDLQDIYGAISNLGISQSPRILSGFERKSDGTLSAGVISYAGSLYLHPDTQGYTISIGDTLWVGEVSSGDVRRYSDDTMQLFSYNMVAANSDRGAFERVGVLTEDNLKAYKVSFIPTNSLVGNQLVDGTVGTSAIRNGSITTEKLMDNSVSDTKLQPKSVTSEKIAAGAVKASNIAEDTINVNQIVDGAVTMSKIGSGAVTEEKIFPESVTPMRLSTDSAFCIFDSDIVTINVPTSGSQSIYLSDFVEYKNGIWYSKPISVVSTTTITVMIDTRSVASIGGSRLPNRIPVMVRTNATSDFQFGLSVLGDVPPDIKPENLQDYTNYYIFPLGYTGGKLASFELVKTGKGYNIVGQPVMFNLN